MCYEGIDLEHGSERKFGKSGFLIQVPDVALGRTIVFDTHGCLDLSVSSVSGSSTDVNLI